MASGTSYQANKKRATRAGWVLRQVLDGYQAIPAGRSSGDAYATKADAYAAIVGAMPKPKVGQPRKLGVDSCPTVQLHVSEMLLHAMDLSMRPGEARTDFIRAAIAAAIATRFEEDHDYEPMAHASTHAAGDVRTRDLVAYECLRDGAGGNPRVRTSDGWRVSPDWREVDHRKPRPPVAAAEVAGLAKVGARA